MFWYPMDSLVPDIYKKVAAILYLLFAEDTEFRTFIDDADAVRKNFHVQTCDASVLGRFEEILGLPATGSVSERRERVIAELMADERFTKKHLNDLITRFIGADDWNVVIDTGRKITLELKREFGAEEIDALFDEIGRRKPAHIELAFAEKLDREPTFDAVSVALTGATATLPETETAGTFFTWGVTRGGQLPMDWVYFKSTCWFGRYDKAAGTRWVDPLETSSPFLSDGASGMFPSPALAMFMASEATPQIRFAQVFTYYMRDSGPEITTPLVSDFSGISYIGLQRDMGITATPWRLLESMYYVFWPPGMITPYWNINDDDETLNRLVQSLKPSVQIVRATKTFALKRVNTSTFAVDEIGDWQVYYADGFWRPSATWYSASSQIDMTIRETPYFGVTGEYAYCAGEGMVNVKDNSGGGTWPCVYIRPTTGGDALILVPQLHARGFLTEQQLSEMGLTAMWPTPTPRPRTR